MSIVFNSSNKFAKPISDEFAPEDIETGFGSEYNDMVDSLEKDSVENAEKESVGSEDKSDNSQDVELLDSGIADEINRRPNADPDYGNMVKCPNAPLGCGGRSSNNRILAKNPHLNGQIEPWSIKDNKGKEVTQHCPLCKNTGQVTEELSEALHFGDIPSMMEQIKSKYPQSKFEEEKPNTNVEEDRPVFSKNVNTVEADPSDLELGSGLNEIDNTVVLPIKPKSTTKKPKKEKTEEITESQPDLPPVASYDEGINYTPIETESPKIIPGATHMNCGCDKRKGLASDRDIAELLKNAETNGFNEGIKNIRKTVADPDEQQDRIEDYIVDQYKCRGDK